MPLTVVASDKEFFSEYTKALVERSKVPISAYVEHARPDREIENALQEFFTAEVVKIGHDVLRARGVGPDFLDETELRSSLDGLPLPVEDRRILEAKIRLLASQMMMPQREPNGGFEPAEPGDGTTPPHAATTGVIKQASHTVDHTCICMASGVPGVTQSLSVINPLPPPPAGQTTLTIAVGLLAFSIYQNKFVSTDWLRLVVEDGAPFGIASDQMHVGLASEVNWAKNIHSWSLCKGTLVVVYQGQKNPVANYMGLDRGCDGADTIVFSKPKALGAWWDIANFDITDFWTVFGGKRLTFTWVID
jgi:hypothetical protein